MMTKKLGSLKFWKNRESARHMGPKLSLIHIYREARSLRNAASTNSRRPTASKVWLKRSIVSPKKASCAASEAADEAEGQRMPSCIPVATCSKMSATAAIPARMRRALLPDIFFPDQNAKDMETAVIQVLAALRQTTAVCAAARAASTSAGKRKTCGTNTIQERIPRTEDLTFASSVSLPFCSSRRCV